MSRLTVGGPRIYVIARPALDIEAIDAFLADERIDWRRSPDASPSEELVEVAGRLCYLSFGARQSPKSNRDYIEHLVGQGHNSVLEHPAWTFLLTGVTRAFTHQFVRHRIGFSYSQLSQQYHDETEADVIRPSLLEQDPELAGKWDDAVTLAKRTYAELVASLDASGAHMSDQERRRLVRSAARTVLPAATATKIAFTANARSLRHFLSERGNLPGDEEMRRVSVLLLETMRREAPALFADFDIKEGHAGPLIVSGA